jgi:hypothetical protein
MHVDPLLHRRKENSASSANDLASPLQSSHPVPNTTVDRMEPARRSMRWNAAEDGARLRPDVHPPTYSSLSLTADIASGPVHGEQRPYGRQVHALRRLETIWSVTAGTDELPTGNQHYQSYHPSTLQQYAGVNHHASSSPNKMARIVGNTEFAPCPAGKRDVAETGSLRLISAQRRQLQQ